MFEATFFAHIIQLHRDTYLLWSYKILFNSLNCKLIRVCWPEQKCRRGDYVLVTMTTGWCVYLFCRRYNKLQEITHKVDSTDDDENSSHSSECSNSWFKSYPVLLSILFNHAILNTEVIQHRIRYERHMVQLCLKTVCHQTVTKSLTSWLKSSLLLLILLLLLPLGA